MAPINDKVKERIDEAQLDLQTRFDDAKTTQDDVSTKAAETSNERKQFIQDEVLKVVTDRYLTTHFGYSGTTPADKDTFVRTQLSAEQQIAILAEFGINAQIRGENGIESELQKAQTRRNDRRSEVKERATKVLAEYNKALEDNQARIQKVQESIAKLETQLERAKDKLGEINLKDDSTAGTMARPGGSFNKEEAAKKQKALIRNLEREIADKRRELAGLQKLQSQFEKLFDERSAEIREALRTQNLYLNDDKKIEDPEAEDSSSGKDEEKSKSSGTMAPTVRGVSRSMLHDFMNAPAERQRTLLRETGSEDIWKMARNLSGLDRRRLRNILNERLDELNDDTVVFNGRTIQKSAFKDMKSMSKEDLDAIKKEIRDFNDDFAHKTVDEIDDFENKMDYVRIGTLLRETQRGFIRKFLGEVQILGWKRETKLSELGKSTFEFAEKQGMRKSKKDDFHDRMRVILGRDKIDEMEKSGRQQLDKTGRGDFDHSSR